MRKNTIDIITLGCSKNLVDSEKLMKQLEANGYKVTHDSDHPRREKLPLSIRVALLAMPKRNLST